jgi:hypothetical protein
VLRQVIDASWTRSELDSKASFGLEATETPWMVNKKLVLRPGLSSRNDECGEKSGGSLAGEAKDWTGDRLS